LATNLLPQAITLAGDIRLVKDELINKIKSLTSDDEFALSMTPPCQGMSKNGIKTILKAIKSGIRPEMDDRNYLILPCLEIIKATNPSVVFFENVPEVKNTSLMIDGKISNFLDFIIQEMTSLGYHSEVAEINFKDYGLPQSRKRVFGVFTLSELNIGNVLTEKTHQITSLRNAIGGLPSLDAKNKKSASKPGFHPLHKVPILRPDLYHWVANTPEGQSALENNLCIECLHKNSNESLYCLKCKALLNKPYVTRNGKKERINGYNSSYRRLRWDRPANTVTTRSAFASSAYNLHPTQNRVLSVYECAMLQGLKPESINWIEKQTGRLYPDFVLRDVIGEALPASFAEMIGNRVMTEISSQTVKENKQPVLV